MNIPRYHEQQLSQKTRTIPRGESEKVPYIHCFRLNVLLIDDLGKILDDFHPDESGMYNDVKAPIPEPLTEMLDPATREAIVETGDESFISCATMLNNLVKAKLMNTNEYKAKSVRAMNRQYNAPGHIKDDPVIQSLTDEYDSLELDFHDKVRNIFRRSVQRTRYLHLITIPRTTINMIHKICLQRAKVYTKLSWLSNKAANDYNLSDGDESDADTDITLTTENKDTTKSIAALATLVLVTNLYGLLNEHCFFKETRTTNTRLFELTLEILGPYAPDEIPLTGSREHIDSSEASTPSTPSGEGDFGMFDSDNENTNKALIEATKQAEAIAAKKSSETAGADTLPHRAPKTTRRNPPSHFHHHLLRPDR